MYHGLPKVLLYAAYKLSVTFSDPGTEDRTFDGTCFLLNRENDLFLVTNRHCVDHLYKDRQRNRSLEFKELKFAGFFHEAGYAELRPIDIEQSDFLFPENFSEDVAVARISKRKLWTSNNQVKSSANMSIDFLAAKDEIDNELYPCDTVASPAYPEWYNQSNNSPIMRMGAIASDPSEDYIAADLDPARRIAYEAFSFSGASGAPVFALETGLRMDGLRYRRGFLVGINAGSLPVRQAEDRRYQGQHSGISYMYKSTIIAELIERASAEQDN